ncbi:diacylglycerol/lipid kinase family protein [Elongatibacter sediminis]|uniref:Diacylglycerol kinase family protein n=1 Tax=Elongatibacter sediminis TaxID=3119006 RepID=A0AAW9RC16_9GAMM
MKLLLVPNPAAGGGRAGRLLPAIRQSLSACDFRFDVLSVADAGLATGLRADSLSGYDAVVAVGGDGTVFGVVNGLMRLAPADRPVLGVIPVGTGNAFVRDLGLEPGDWRGAVDLLAAGRTRLVDVGEYRSLDHGTGADRFYWVNVIGAGFVVDAGRTAQGLKAFGRSAYTWAVLWRLMGLRSYRFRLELDGRVLDQDLLFAEISNTRYTGTHFLIAPQARCDDGEFDVTLVSRMPRWKLLRLFPMVFTGRHVQRPEVRMLRARAIRLVAPAGLGLMADGEFRGTMPAEMRCLPRALRVFCR